MRVVNASMMLGVLIAASPAHAWLCTNAGDALSTPPNTGALWWGSRHITYAIDLESIPEGLTDAPATLDASFDVWKNLEGSSGCGNASVTDLIFERVAQKGLSHIGYDIHNPKKNDNLLMFVNDGWTDLDPPESFSGNHLRSVIALTTTTWIGCTTQILSADIEFNADYFTFGTNGSNTLTDLKNTAVHEIGHLLGLAHTQVSCENTPNNPGPTDPTMCASARLGQTNKRDLACDDIKAITFRYPANTSNQFCIGSTLNSTCGQCINPSNASSYDSKECAAYLENGILTPIDFDTPRTDITIHTKTNGRGCSNTSATATGWIVVLYALCKHGLRFFRYVIQIYFR